jgi:broad specificity phosphatase PhoE
MNPTLPKLLLIRIGATDLDLQGRICGRLDLPLSETGLKQAQQTAEQLRWHHVPVIYRAPSMAARQTADCVAELNRAKVKVDNDLENIDFGLWHGKRLDELKNTLPTAYRCWSEHPENLFPPDGESIKEAISRVERVLSRLAKRHMSDMIGLVVPAPIAAIIVSQYRHRDLDCSWCRVPADAGWQELTGTEAVAKAAGLAGQG